MDNKWYAKILKLLKMETESLHGKINLAGVIIMAMFSLIYTANDTICHLISSTADVIKTIALKEDIYHAYESINVMKAVFPTAFVLIFCLLFLVWHENKKKK